MHWDEEHPRFFTRWNCCTHYPLKWFFSFYSGALLFFLTPRRPHSSPTSFLLPTASAVFSLHTRMYPASWRSIDTMSTSKLVTVCFARSSSGWQIILFLSVCLDWMDAIAFGFAPFEEVSSMERDPAVVKAKKEEMEWESWRMKGLFSWIEWTYIPYWQTTHRIQQSKAF